MVGTWGGGRAGIGKSHHFPDASESWETRDKRTDSCHISLPLESSEWAQSLM